MGQEVVFSAPFFCRKPIMPRNKYVTDLSIILLIALFLRIMPVFFGSAKASDIIYFKSQAETILKNQNIYKATHEVFPYSPLTMFIPAICLILSGISRMPFHITMKLPAIIGDISLSIAIYYWVMKFKNDRKLAFTAAVFYAINPLAILISAFQGNLMPLPVLFTFLAVMMIIYDFKKNYRLSALLLGLAIAFRGYPILLLPLILLKSQAAISKKIQYAAYSILPTVLISLPFLILDHRSFFTEIFGYKGNVEYGYVAMERAISYFCLISSLNPPLTAGIAGKNIAYLGAAMNHLPSNMLITHLAAFSKAIFFAVYSIIILRYKRLSLLKLILAACLAFYFFFDGTASQYFIWILPFLYFLDDKFSKFYVLFGTYAVVSVYLCFHPFTLFGNFTPNPYPALAGVLLNEFIALFLFWSLCGVWLFRLLAAKDIKQTS